MMSVAAAARFARRGQAADDARAEQIAIVQAVFCYDVIVERLQIALGQELSGKELRANIQLRLTHRAAGSAARARTRSDGIGTRAAAGTSHARRLRVRRHWRSPDCAPSHPHG